MKKLFFTSALLITALFFNSCSSDDDNNNSSNTIVDFVSSNSDYSSLGAALEVANLTDVLNGTTNYTVFAPNNAAFAAFLTDNGFASLDAVPVDVLTQVLLNHVITGTALSTDLSTNYYKTNATFGTTSNNLNMYINTADGVLINGSTSVTSADITVDNGVIHAVNSVIGLPTIVTFATADSTFDTLVAALTREDEFTFVDLLSEANDGTTSAPFTVFAPTNDAFSGLLSEGLGFDTLAGIPTATLEATLNTHVVDSANVLAIDLTDGMTVNTLGDDFTINTVPLATFTDQRDRTGNIVITDVQAANGVIHVVDKVILPNLN
jgi:uncharacterized surface protein with fasciclin (FAS1) repeats